MRYLISDKYKFVISLVPKVGTRTLLDALVRNPQYDFEIRNAINVKDREVKGYYKVIFVRDPYERLLSTYINKVKFAAPTIKKKFWPLYKLKKMSFTRFLKHIQSCPIDEHWRPQVEFVNALKFDHVGLLENMEADLNDMMERLGIDHKLDLPHLNYSDDKKVTYKDKYLDKRKQKVTKVSRERYYTEQAQSIVSILYSEDIELHSQLS